MNPRDEIRRIKKEIAELEVAISKLLSDLPLNRLSELKDMSSRMTELNMALEDQMSKLVNRIVEPELPKRVATFSSRGEGAFTTLIYDDGIGEAMFKAVKFPPGSKLLPDGRIVVRCSRLHQATSQFKQSELFSILDMVCRLKSDGGVNAEQ